VYNAMSLKNVTFHDQSEALYVLCRRVTERFISAGILTREWLCVIASSIAFGMEMCCAADSVARCSTGAAGRV